MSKNLILFLLIGITAMTSCTPNPKRLENRSNDKELLPTEEGYSMIFYKLDDYAIVYINDKEVFDSRDIGLRIKEDVLFDMQPFLNRGTNNLKIEGYNGECSGCNQNRWGVTYEIFKDGESIDYRSEDSNDQHSDVGLKMTNEHTLSL
ncbi:hypothetical protein BFP72_05865 [Reichenbachiella sp. 5M10]|uniref:hypothetical protein n=1 Tax=Reichenbachiella sp. 5M10 TaxID=1889772 RepID=UPI000C153864|nr:hypothetical protein [Reichenbachiella sp. 5M10]PIB34952.1 hypothetical protein BFP72_05865 [Reichenbachiella sp. 5M10]